MNAPPKRKARPEARSSKLTAASKFYFGTFVNTPTDTLENFQRVLRRVVRRYSSQFWNLAQLQARVDTELLRRGRTQ